MVPLSAPITAIEKSEVNVQYVITGPSPLIVNAEGPNTLNRKINDIEYHIRYISNRGSGLIIEGDLKGKDARIKLFTNDMPFTCPDLVLPGELTAIEKEAFSGGAFRYVKLPDNAVSIGPRAFADCPNLAYVYIPPQVTGISPDAFDGLEDLTILGVETSYADTFAREHGISFMAILDDGSTDSVIDSND